MRARRAREKKIRVVIAGPDGTEQEVDLDADAEITLAADGADGDSGGIVGYETPSDEDLSDAAAKEQAAQAAPRPRRSRPSCPTSSSSSTSSPT